MSLASLLHRSITAVLPHHLQCLGQREKRRAHFAGHGHGVWSGAGLLRGDFGEDGEEAGEVRAAAAVGGGLGGGVCGVVFDFFVFC